MIEIRWHGRGGQGAKTASLLLADIAFNTGKYIQGFPEYGPERMGAPMTAYNRIDTVPIRSHSNVYTPDLVVVVDDSLISSIDVTNGLKEDGALIINTSYTPNEILDKLPNYTGKLYTIDATKISKDCLKANYPNTAMLAAVIKIINLMSKQEFLDNMNAAFKHKFARKPEVIEPNMLAITRAFDEVKEAKKDE